MPFIGDAKATIEMSSISANDPANMQFNNSGQPHKLYKRRYAGIAGLFFLDIAAGMVLPWFGPIAHEASVEFGISLNQINWLANIVSCVFVPAAFLVPWIVSKYGVRRCCQAGSTLLLVSGWIRYSGTASSLSSSGSYALLILGQFFGAIAHAMFQVLAPKYSQTWFSLKERTTATMLISIANPLGGAIGQLVSPRAGSVRTSVLVQAIICTAVSPCVFLISEAPPTPPTRAAAQKSRTLKSLARDLAGKKTDDGESMTPRERFDFLILSLIFGIFAGAVNTYGALSSQYLKPYGYSSSTSGLMGSSILIAGVVTALLTAPLFDRVFTKHLGLTVKVIVPVISLAWLGLVWAIRPNNTGPLFAVFVIIGGCSVTLLPVAIELAVELTRAPDSSSALLWATSNAFTIMLILAEPALKAGPKGSPPLNMRNGMILQASLALAFAFLVIPFKGEQNRRKRDELEEVEQRNTNTIYVARPSVHIGEASEERHSTAALVEAKHGSVV